MKKSLTPELLATYAEVESKRDVVLAHRAVYGAGLIGACSTEMTRDYPFVFNHVCTGGDITNQRQSGRCWIFAGLNVIRTIMFEKLGVKSIELSQAYVQFYDKLEKANFFLETELTRLSEPLNDRLNTYLRKVCAADGGHWAMFTNLVKKYGIVPSSCMADGACSKNTRELNQFLSDVLNSDLLKLRKAYADGANETTLHSMKEDMMEEVYRILVIAIGAPTKEFSYEYMDKDGKAVKLPKMTPLEFFEKYVGEELDDWICLAHAPCDDWQEYVKYAARDYNNVIEGEPIVFFNVPMEEFKGALVRSICDNRPVWFGAEVSRESRRQEGYLVKGINPLDELTGVYPKMDKKEMLDLGVATCAHAMVFTGVNLDENGNPNRFKVENSWGTDNGDKGFYVMDNGFFDDYVYQLFVNSKYVSPEILAKYKAAETVYVDPFNTMWAELD